MTPLSTCNILNTLWALSNYRYDRRFSHDCRAVEQCQKRYLVDVLNRNRATSYGQKYNFAGIDTIEKFQRVVPITTYEDYLTYIDRIASGEKAVLTSEEVKLFEPSSGSSSAAKLIPYTDSLRRDFQRGIGPWISSLFRHYPRAKSGKAYWAISPKTATQDHHGQIRIGFDDDSSYLGLFGKWFFSQIAVLDENSVAQAGADAFKHHTLISMLNADNLSLISVWSPTFLTLLCDYFIENEEQLLKAVASSAGRKGEQRAREIAARDSVHDFSGIWPELAVISCWTDGSSREEARRLQSYFPGSVIQGKGLLATEAFVSLPYLFKKWPVLAVNSHFFEFLDKNGRCLAAHQVEAGEVYSVVVTTSGGLYRYKLGDLVRINDFFGQAPCLEFIGKSELVSDMFGEKLHADHVAKTIHAVFTGCDFAMLAPDKSAAGWHYTLYVQCDGALSPECISLLENRLCENPNYSQCRHLGQLGEAQIFRIKKAATLAYTNRLVNDGMRFGDIKLTPLSKLQSWSEYFCGRYENS